MPDQKPRLGDIEAAIRLEAPGVEADRQVVGEKIGAGEIEIDQPRHLAVAEEDIVGEQIGMDDPARQPAGPRRFEKGELLPQFGGEARLHLVGARRAGFVIPAPAGGPEIIAPPHRKRRAGAMQPGQRTAERRAVERLDAARPHAVEKGDDRRWPAAQFAQRLAVARPHRGRAGDALMGEVIHQRDEERQVRRGDPLLVKRQDEVALHGGQQEIGILHPLGDALARQHLADVVQGDKDAQFLIADFGVDRHARLSSFPGARPVLCGARASPRVRRRCDRRGH